MSVQNRSVARVSQYTAEKIGKVERHNERKNTTYGNINVDSDRSELNISFAGTNGLTYNDYLQEKIDAKEVTTHGLKKDAKLFDEMIIDVNTDYFEEHGGYEYARQFYEEAFHFAQDLYGEKNIISAVMHADEINVAATEKYGHPVYHYHLHVVALPVVEKELRWSKRCKDPQLRGTVKEVIQQISHSKKWKSDTPELDEQGNPIVNKNGKQVFRKSYSILQDQLFDYLSERGFRDFERGELGSTAQHLSTLDYQIKKDSERLEKIAARIEEETLSYKEAHQDFKTYSEIDDMGQKKLGGKYSLNKEDYQSLTELAKEGIASRGVIKEQQREISMLRRRNHDLSTRVENLTGRLMELKELCKPYLDALEHFPAKVKEFFKSLAKEKTAEKTKTLVKAEPAPGKTQRKKSRDLSR